MPSLFHLKQQYASYRLKNLQPEMTQLIVYIENILSNSRYDYNYERITTENKLLTFLGFDTDITTEQRQELTDAKETITNVLQYDFTQLPQGVFDEYIQAAEKLSYHQNAKSLRTIGRWMLGIGVAMLCASMIMLCVCAPPLIVYGPAVVNIFISLMPGGFVVFASSLPLALLSIPGEDMKQYADDIKTYASIH